MPILQRQVWGRLVRDADDGGVTGPTGPTGPTGGIFVPGANPGEVVFVDGSGHAATSADLAFDDTTDTLKLGTAGGAAIWFRDSTIDPANPRLIMEQPVGQYILRLRGQDNDGVGNAILEGINTWVDATDYNGYRLDNSSDENRLLSYATGMQAEQGWRIGTFLNYIQIMTSAFAPRTVDTIGISVGNVPNFYSFTPQTFFPDGAGDNAVDLGSDGDPIYGTVRWRSLKCGTSVVSNMFTSDPGAQLNLIPGAEGDIYITAPGPTFGAIHLSSIDGIDTDKPISPNIHNTIDFGQSGLAWKTGYFGTSVVTPLLTADAVTFPDADPHVAGAGYWVTGVLTKSAG